MNTRGRYEEAISVFFFKLGMGTPGAGILLVESADEATAAQRITCNQLEVKILRASIGFLIKKL